MYKKKDKKKQKEEKEKTREKLKKKGCKNAFFKLVKQKLFTIIK